MTKFVEHRDRMSSTVPILLILIVTLCQGECPIECYCDEMTVCSGDQQLSVFPQLRPRSSDKFLTTRLELHDFLVESLDRDTFLSLVGNLTELRLTNNVRLGSMDNGTFSVLWGEGGGGGGGGESLTGAQALQLLNLRTMDLSGNSFKYFVGGGRLKRLRVLDLSSNRLQQVYQLGSLVSLESINLRDNLIHHLEGSLFQSLRNLQYINLDSNRIGRLDPTTFSNLPSLAHLILSSNPISNLLPGFFWNSRVQFVDVSRVGLSRIPTSLTTSVRDFRCANNNLTTIRQSDFDSYPNVGLLVLDENSIETVEDDAFGRLDFLARLWINGNRLSRIPKNLPPSLRSLQLEDNRIKSISAGDFKNLKYLEELNLHGNQIASLPAFIFSELTHLRNLDLRSNQLDTIEEGSFGNLTRLETLEISQNPVRVFVNGAFHDLQKLSLLHLSRLEEGTIEFDTSVFHPLFNLQILELDDSPYIAQNILRDSALSYFSSLIELNLQRCNLMDLSAVASALLESPSSDSIRVVKLSGNPWDCFGSGTESSESEFKTFIQLVKKNIIVDVDQMICGNLRGIKVISAVMHESANETNQGHKIIVTSTSSTSTSTFTPTPNPTPTPTPAPAPTATSAAPTVNVVVTPPALHEEGSGSDVKSYFYSSTTAHTPVTSQSDSEAEPVPNKVTTLKNLSTPIRHSVAVGTASTSAVVGGSRFRSTSSDSSSPFPKRIKAAGRGVGVGFGVGVGLTITEKPTRSYFEDQTPRPPPQPTTTTRGTRTTTRGERTLPISPGAKSEDENRRKLFSFLSSNTHAHDENLKQHERASTNKKTNDDNAIIDEERNPTSLEQRQLYHESQKRVGETETVEGSIDGFPAFHTTRDGPVAKETYTSSSKVFNHPNPSYLKSSHGRKKSDYEIQPTPVYSRAVIIKTLVVSAVACLLSILFLLLLSVIVFRFSSWRHKTRPIPLSIGRIKWDKKCEDCDSTSAEDVSYHHLNCSLHRGPTGTSYTRLGDHDIVELSGITNRLYSENEDIYHIT